MIGVVPFDLGLFRARCNRTSDSSETDQMIEERNEIQNWILEENIEINGVLSPTSVKSGQDYCRMWEAHFFDYKSAMLFMLRWS